MFFIRIHCGITANKDKPIKLHSCEQRTWNQMWNIFHLIKYTRQEVMTETQVICAILIIIIQLKSRQRIVLIENTSNIYCRKMRNLTMTQQNEIALVCRSSDKLVWWNEKQE